MGRLSAGLDRAFAMLPVSPSRQAPLCSKDDCLNAASDLQTQRSSDLQILHDGVMQRFPVVSPRKAVCDFSVVHTAVDAGSTSPRVSSPYVDTRARCSLINYNQGFCQQDVRNSLNSKLVGVFDDLFVTCSISACYGVAHGFPVAYRPTAHWRGRRFRSVSRHSLPARAGDKSSHARHAAESGSIFRASSGGSATGGCELMMQPGT
jgi:hypothetical protein